MQYASGAYMSIFWGASIIWDLFTNSITIFIVIIMLAFGQNEHWCKPGELAIVFLILFLYNFAMMPVICLLSLIFSKPTTGMNVVSIANTILSKSSRKTEKKSKHFCFRIFYHLIEFSTSFDLLKKKAV